MNSRGDHPPVRPPNDFDRDGVDDRRSLYLEAREALARLDDPRLGLVSALSGDTQALQELALLFHGLAGAAAMADQQDLSERAGRCEDALVDAASSASWPPKGEAIRLRSACRSLADGVTQLEDVIGASELKVLSHPTEGRRWVAGWLFDRVSTWLAAASTMAGVSAQLEREGEAVYLGQRNARALLFPVSQLVRNALAHGAQPPAVRHRLGKLPAMRLRLACQRSGNILCLAVDDDGPGLDHAALARSLLAFRQPDRGVAISGDEAIFIPGLTTARSTDPWAGRGLGLPLVQQWVRDRRGHLEVTSQPGEGFRVDIRVPFR